MTLGRYGIGIVAGQFRKPLSLAGSRHQVLGFLFRGGDSGGVLAFGGDQRFRAR